MALKILFSFWRRIYSVWERSCLSSRTRKSSRCLWKLRSGILHWFRANHQVFRKRIEWKTSKYFASGKRQIRKVWPNRLSLNFCQLRKRRTPTTFLYREKLFSLQKQRFVFQNFSNRHFTRIFEEANIGMASQDQWKRSFQAKIPSEMGNQICWSLLVQSNFAFNQSWSYTLGGLFSEEGARSDCSWWDSGRNPQEAELATSEANRCRNLKLTFKNSF